MIELTTNSRGKSTATTMSDQGFYIGDICYVLPEKVYFDEWINAGKGWDGEFHTTRGYAFGTASTAYGDGYYNDQDWNGYPVDAGNIGIVPLELVEDEERAKKLGNIFYGEGWATMDAENGRFEFTLPNGEKILIDTH